MGNCLKRSTADDISLLRGGNESGRESSDFGPEIMQPVFYPSPAIGGIGGGIIGGSGPNSIGFGAAAASSSSSSSTSGGGGGVGVGGGASFSQHSSASNMQIGQRTIVTGGHLTEDEQIKMAKRIGLIQHLPIGVYTGCRKSRECVICMMEFNNGDSIRYLPCMHTYHVQCIDDWLMRSLTCPSCMEPVDAALLTTYEAS